MQTVPQPVSVPKREPEQHTENAKTCPHAFPYPAPVAGMPPMDPPGSPASFYWLVRHLLHTLTSDGITISVSEATINLLNGKRGDTP